MNDSPDNDDQQHTEPTIGESASQGAGDAAPEAAVEVGEKEVAEKAGSVPAQEDSKPDGTETSDKVDAGEAPTKDADNQSDKASASAEATQPLDAEDTSVEQSGSTEAAKVEEGSASTNQPIQDADAAPTNVSAEPSPAVSHTALRPLSPSSRTSTPPLAAGSSAPAKKFSAMNVNKKFLSKTGTSPSPSGVGPSAKLNPLSSRPASSPVPIAAPSSRLLSTKLTTVSSSKPTEAPQPPTSASSSSPWARPTLPTPVSLSSSATGLHQPIPSKRGGLVGMTAPMGQSQNIAANRPAWRAVNADGVRRPAVGMSRDFPTASEVAQGKRAAESNAQAQAAQAEALLQGLNVFTHLEPNAHRWDDDDDEDDVIDFGDGEAQPTSSSNSSVPRPELPTDQPVGKSERFVEDFDRSWPRSAAQAASEERPRPPDLRKRESDRVLFNATSNRLEAPSTRPTPQAQNIQPTRLLHRSDNPSAGTSTGGSGGQRQPPPHLAGAAPSGRPLPPHMAGQPDRSSAQPAHPPPTSRTAWGSNRDAERQLPPHMANRPELPAQSSVFEKSRSPTNPISHLPPRKSFSQTNAPGPPAPVPEAANAGRRPSASAPVADATDTQAAEMHSAAEKARLRRQAEEEERRAAADRARQKAKELEAKFGAKPSGTAAQPAETHSASAAAAPPTPSYTIAQRPRPPPEATSTINAGPPKNAPTGPSRLPSRPSIGESSRPQDDHWRSKAPPAAPVSSAPVPRAQEPQSRIIGNRTRPVRPTAESFFEHKGETEAGDKPYMDKGKEKAGIGSTTIVPEIPLLQRVAAPPDPSAKPELGFDDMLARIKAAMGPSHVVEASVTDSASPEAPPPQVRRQKAAPSAKSTTSVPPPTSKPEAPPAPPHPKETFFEVSEIEIPRSPPPAWRTYVVRLPKHSKPVMEQSSTRQSALGRQNQPPRGWLMSFQPPMDLNPKTLSLPELLLPTPAPRRFFNKTETAPLVSISQRTLQPFVKKARSGSSSAPARPAEAAQATPVPTRNTPASSQPAQSRSSADRWRVAEEPRPVVPEPVATQSAVDLIEPPARKAKSPVKGPTGPRPGSVAKYEGMAIGLSDDQSVEPDMKSGVRFMVSSELEGDSLLDEVNKMSLDTVEETETGVAASGSGAEAPKSPKQTGTSSSRLPSSPNAVSQWSNQRDHLKNVWDQSGQSSTATKAVSPASGLEGAPNHMYPTANTSTSGDATATQPLSYSSQAFSPGSATFPMRQSPGINGMHPQNSSDNLSTLAYGPPPKSHGGAINGYASNGYSGMNQHGVWSAPSYGSSMSMGSPVYGYGSKSGTSPVDPKASMAFNPAPGSKEMAQGQYAYSSIPSPQHYARSPYGPFSPSYAAQQQLQQQQQRMASAPNGTYGYAGYNPSAASNAARAGMSGRFANGAGASAAEYGGYTGSEGHYYGTVGARSGGHVQPSQTHAAYYTSSGAASIGQAQAQAQGVNGHAMQAQGQGQGQGQRRKMW